MSDSEEDDYMSMIIPDPGSSQPETSIQRRKRREREGEERARAKSKKELAAEAEKARDTGLATSLPTSNKGFQLLSKLGYKPGDRLGAASNPNALAEPVGLDVKEDRGGIGMDSEKKRKVREALEAAEGDAKRVKADEGDFRERVAKEREEKRNEGQWWSAMRVAEGFDSDDAAADGAQSLAKADAKHLDSNTTPKDAKDDDSAKIETPVGITEPPLPLKEEQASHQRPNILWRPLALERATQDREKRMRHELVQSLSRNATYDDPEEDRHDRLAFGKDEQDYDLDAEDPELDAYIALPIGERLEQVVQYLRKRWNYCFWCKYRYDDASMEGCPGLKEEDHD